MSKKDDINDQYMYWILGAAAVSGLATGSFGIAMIVGIGLSTICFCNGAIRF
ncbi:MAG: hypothetical protein ACRC10_04415 [Thermoguttaceae bacterium]